MSGLARLKHAIERHALLEKHAHVLVGISGGVDSLVLLHLLQAYNSKFRQEWRITAAHVDPCFPGEGSQRLARMLEHASVDRLIVRTNIHTRLQKVRNRCFVCSRCRRERLIRIAEKMSVFNIALGHHRDDIAETLLLNMFYAGRISTLMPRQSVMQGRFALVRPMYYMTKDEITAIARAAGIKALKMDCPYYKDSNREKIRGLLRELQKESPDLYSNVFRSVFNVMRSYMPS